MLRTLELLSSIYDCVSTMPGVRSTVNVQHGPSDPVTAAVRLAPTGAGMQAVEAVVQCYLSCCTPYEPQNRTVRLAGTDKQACAQALRHAADAADKQHCCMHSRDPPTQRPRRRRADRAACRPAPAGSCSPGCQPPLGLPRSHRLPRQGSAAGHRRPIRKRRPQGWPTQARPGTAAHACGGRPRRCQQRQRAN